MTSHKIENHSIAVNRMRSAKPPTMSAGVMMANVSWNVANTVSGMEPLSESSSTPRSHAFDSPPSNGPPSANVSE